MQNGIMRGHAIGQLQQADNMLQQAAEPGMMKLLGSGRFAVCLCQSRIGQQCIQQQLQIRIGKALHKPQQLAPKLIHIACGARQHVTLFHFAGGSFPQVLDLHLQSVVKARNSTRGF